MVDVRDENLRQSQRHVHEKNGMRDSKWKSGGVEDTTEALSMK